MGNRLWANIMVGYYICIYFMNVMTIFFVAIDTSYKDLANWCHPVFEPSCKGNFQRFNYALHEERDGKWRITRSIHTF